METLLRLQQVSRLILDAATMALLDLAKVQLNGARLLLNKNTPYKIGGGGKRGLLGKSFFCFG